MRRMAAILVSALALAAPPAFAQGGPPDHAPGGPPSILHLAQELGLTDAQKAQIRGIQAKYMDGELGEAMEAMREARRALGGAIHDVAATDETVTRAAAAVAALEPTVAIARHRLFVEVSAVLTPEQNAQLAELRPGPPGRGRGRF